MNKLYRYGFWILFLLLLTSLNYIYFTLNSYSQNKTETTKTKPHSYRLSSFFIAEKIIGAKVQDINVMNPVNLKNETINLKKTTILILLSNLGCSPCQNRELKNLQRLYELFDSKSINIIAVFNESRNKILQYKKINKVSFPCFYLESNEIKQYSFNDKYPQILLVKDNRVVSAFLPVPDDDEFSEWYFKTLYDKILAY